RVVVTTSADGLSTTTQRDTTGAGAFDQTRTDVTVLNADGSRTETRTDRDADSSLKDKSVTTTSADGLSRTIQVDAWGTGTFCVTETDVTALNANGSRTETVSDFNGDGSLLSRTATTTSADGLSTTTQQDTDGDGSFDQSRTDVIVLNADGSRTETVTDRNADGSVRDESVTTTSSSGLSRSIERQNFVGGVLCQTQSDIIVVSADGSRIETVSDRRADGTLLDRTVTTTSPNGLSSTTQQDTTGAGTFDQTRTDVKVLNPDGSTTETVADRYADGSLAD